MKDKDYFYVFTIKELTWCIKSLLPGDPNLFIGTQECLGVTNHYEKVIYINDNLSFEETKRTLKHELTHAYITCYLLDRKESYTEEDLCEFVAIYGEDIVKQCNKIMKSWK